jgi:hypothetical protein
MKTLGIALVMIGLVTLVIGGIGYSRQTTILDVGGIKATATEHRTIPLAPVAGAVVLLGGIALLVVPRLRRA